MGEECVENRIFPYVIDALNSRRYDGVAEWVNGKSEKYREFRIENSYTKKKESKEKIGPFFIGWAKIKKNYDKNMKLKDLKHRLIMALNSIYHKNKIEELKPENEKWRYFRLKKSVEELLKPSKKSYKKQAKKQIETKRRRKKKMENKRETTVNTQHKAITISEGSLRPNGEACESEKLPPCENLLSRRSTNNIPHEMTFIYNSGVPGIPAEAGTRMAAGIPGIPGVNAGFYGVPGKDGLDGLSGVPAEAGTPVSPGIPGVDAGFYGVPGKDGLDGLSGVPAEAETPIPAEISGIPGVNAEFSGVPGKYELDGLPVAKGECGLPGFPGLIGEQCFPGLPAIPGPVDQGPPGEHLEFSEHLVTGDDQEMSLVDLNIKHPDEIFHTELSNSLDFHFALTNQDLIFSGAQMSSYGQNQTTSCENIWCYEYLDILRL